jgi:hypothetical protein
MAFSALIFSSQSDFRTLFPMISAVLLNGRCSTFRIFPFLRITR